EVDIKEPRIVGAPNSTSACDPVNAPEGANCQDPNAFILAWGSVKNTYAHIENGVELDVFVTKTRDGGRTYEPLKLLSANVGVPLDPEGEPDFESQLIMKPNGDNLYAVWMETSTDAAGNEDTVVRYRAEADLDDAGAPITVLEDGTEIYNLTRPITVDQGSVSGIVVSTTTATGTEYTYPMQQFSYNVTGLEVGSTISVTINFGGTVPEDAVLLKVNADGSTVEVESADWELIGDNLVQVSITDGGYLDEDGVKDGAIIDPVTVGVPVATVEPTPVSTSSSGGSLGLIELLIGLGLLARRRVRVTRK
ncbi:hypothetical protein H5185_17470, partial [Shewanella sp. SG44-6]|uniref:choice-of-anchor U domain-containing protein n=1 Tax=Shewanella sp. SG44-6 TaxID=2760959 RepID=UPI0016031F30